MQIEMTIAADTLGDSNTDAQNSAYAAAVREAIQAEYPSAEVSVSILRGVSGYNAGKTVVLGADDDIDADEIRFEAGEIARRIWDGGAY